MENLRLPHGKFLVFVDSLLEKKSDTVRFKTHFPFIPTLPMLCEAGAQGSSFFSFSPHCNAAVVLSYRDVRLLQKLRTIMPQISLSITNSIGDSYLFDFEVYEDDIIVASGKIAMFCITI
ncbi:MAG: hypothetical protein JXQ68_05900 [Campylobacterales bacterium]|nr:hypothetical protein [Campylobacterales bacterium]